MTAFFLYKDAVLQKVKAENLDKKMTELICIISDMWRRCDTATKAKYQELSDQAKCRYQEERKDFDAIIQKKPIKKSKSRYEIQDSHKCVKIEGREEETSSFNVEVKTSKWNFEVKEGSLRLELMAEGFDQPKIKEISISDFF